jgi:hypothetical protein
VCCHADDAWHTDDDGNLYASDTFVSIANAVWCTEYRVITAKQLVWTDLVVSLKRPCYLPSRTRPASTCSVDLLVLFTDLVDIFVVAPLIVTANRGGPWKGCKSVQCV